MQPPVWTPPVVLSPDEHAIVARIRRAKLFIFLRQERHQLFSDAYQAELATLYQESALGRDRRPPVWR
jgi:transposase